MEYKVCACACVHECKCIMSHDHECGNESGEESSHRSPGVRRTMSAYGTFNIKKLDNGMETWHVKTVATRREKISDLPPESARLPGLALGPARVSGGRSVITSRNIVQATEQPNLGIAGELCRKFEATGCCEPTRPKQFSTKKVFTAGRNFLIEISISDHSGESP